MSRAPQLDPGAMDEHQKKAYQAIVDGPHGRIVGPYMAWLQSPELCIRARNLSEYIRFNSRLPKHLSELAILIAGRHWKAEYEFYAHSKLGREAGLSEEVIRALAEKRRPDFKNEDEEIIYNFCTEMFETNRIGDATFARAEKAFGLPTVTDLVAVIGYYSLVSMTLNAFQIPLPPGEKSPFPD